MEIEFLTLERVGRDLQYSNGFIRMSLQKHWFGQLILTESKNFKKNDSNHSNSPTNTSQPGHKFFQRHSF